MYFITSCCLSVGGKTEPDALCPPGYYCPNGTKHAYDHACNNGTFNPHDGQDEQADCYDCLIGE